MSIGGNERGGFTSSFGLRVFPQTPTLLAELLLSLIISDLCMLECAAETPSNGVPAGAMGGLMHKVR